MRKIWQGKEGGNGPLPTVLKTILTLTIICCYTSVLFAQDYLGIGLHLSPPVEFDFTHTPYVRTKPRAGIGGSFTYKKEWTVKKNGAWYAEVGLTLQGLRYYQVSYVGDSTTIWSDFVNQHTGFPSILAGAGRTWLFGNSKNRFSIGGELLFLITQDLDSIYSHDFSISNHPINDAVSPFFPRLNLGYSRDVTFFRMIPGRFQIYATLSFQYITKGKQYILDREIGTYKEGRYHVNNSEFGVKLFTALNKKEYKKRTDAASVENVILARSERKQKFRISLNGQLFKVPNTVYHIPQVDSFAIGSRPIMLPQIGLIAEIPFKKNHLWSAVLGLGLGKRAGTLVFKSDGDFPSHGQPIHFEQSVDIGNYGIVNAGLSRRHAIKGLVLSHTLTASTVLPLENEYVYLGVPLIANSIQPIPFEDAILEGWMNYANGRENIVVGIEYNPELIFTLRKPVFIGLGLIANYSFGGVIGHGTYKVYNDYTTYYGASLQKFAKLGVSIRLGFEK